MMDVREILEKLKSLSNPKNVAGMARFGINPENTLGVSIPNLRKLAKKIGESHELAQNLWDSKIHEAKILASMIDRPNLVTEKQMDSWVKDFDSWDVCDQVCNNLFCKTQFAFKKVRKWPDFSQEYIRRAAFALMACLAVDDKVSDDKKFLDFFPMIKKRSTDERNFVKKAVNWALRNIGKRNEKLNKAAIKFAKEIQKIDSKSAKWIAANALSELESPAVQKRLKK